MRNAKVSVYKGLFIQDKLLEFSYSDLEDFKTGLLKRLGNISVTNKMEKQRKLVKEIIYKSKSIKDIENTVHMKTDWHITVKTFQ